MAKKPQKQKLTTSKFTARKEREQKQAKTALIITGVILGLILLIVGYVLVDSYVIKPNKVVATVGDEVIRARQLDKNVRYARYNMIQQASRYYQSYFEIQSIAPEYAQQFLGIAQRNAVELNQGDIIGNRVINDMIDDIIIKEEADKLGITVTDEEVDRYIQENFDYYADGTPTPANTATPYSTPTVSSQQETLIAPPETEEAPDAEENGEAPGEQTEPETPADEPSNPPEEEAEEPIDEDNLEPVEDETEEPTEEETELAPEPTVEGTATLVPTITPSPTPYTKRLFDKNYSAYLSSQKQIGLSKSDIRRITEGTLLREKLIEVITADVPAEEDQVWARHILVVSLDEAEAIIERLEAGEDFGEIAKELSTDPGSKDNGGDLGWFGRGRMVPEFEEAAFGLEEIGDISEPVNSTHGWHIIQLIGKGKNPVGEQEHERLKDNFFSDWLKDIRDSRSDIKFNDGWEQYVPIKPELPRDFYNAIMNFGN